MDLRERGCKSSGSRKSNRTAAKSSKSTGPMSPISGTSLRSKTHRQLTLFAEDSPANPLVLPGSEKARRMTVTSGRKCLELLRKSSPVGSLLKMCLESSTWNSTKCFLTWKAKVTRQGHSLYQLAPSMPRTGEIESGLLVTPATIQIEPGEDRYEKRKAFRESIGRHWVPGCLAEQIAMSPTLPTPAAFDAYDITNPRKDSNIHKGGRHSVSLTHQIAMLPTPKARDYKGADNNPHSKRNQKNSELNTVVGGKKTGLKLQPGFVEWMMGFPLGFTDIGSKGSKPSAMPSSRRSQRKLEK